MTARAKPTKRNSPDSAEKLYTEFHGKKPDKFRIIPVQLVDADYNNHPKLTQLGKLSSLWVGERVELVLDDHKGVVDVVDTEEEHGWCVHWEYESSGNPPDVAAEPKGNSIYFVGGNQDLSRWLPELKAYGTDTSKDIIDCGPCLLLCYVTQKPQFGSPGDTEFFHALGEETGQFPGDNGLNPRLIYNRIRRKFYLAGGSYRIEPDGIID